MRKIGRKHCAMDAISRMMLMKAYDKLRALSAACFTLHHAQSAGTIAKCGGIKSLANSNVIESVAK